MMICSISGETCQEPVISKSGNVYEKRVITKWLEANQNTDPITHQSLSPEELIAVKVTPTIKPRPITATSVPSMLQLFQNEWDSLMLEVYQLKQHLESTRQELSHVLYQHDAACRVIARLIKERDDALNALSNAQAQIGRSAKGSTSDMDVDSLSGLPEGVKIVLQNKSIELSGERKIRTINPELTSTDDVKGFKVISSNSFHKASEPGVLCLDIHPQKENIIVTGGVDKNVILFDREIKKISQTLKDHKGPVTDVLFHTSRNIILSTSEDNTGKVWIQAEEGYHPAHTVTTHKEQVVGCSLHPAGAYWATGSQDKSWGFHDLSSGECLLHIPTDFGVRSINFHPDGLILGTGTMDNHVKIWDIKLGKKVASFEEHEGPVVSLSFSENGYVLASASEDNTVKLWDLRKLRNLQTIDLGANFGLLAVGFDFSGTYMAVAGQEIRIFAGRNFEPLTSFTKHSQTVTDVKFGSNAKFLASTSMDRSLKLWGNK